jgi:hypothetical protein
MIIRKPQNEKRQGSVITVKIIPRSSKNEIVEIMENEIIKIKLTSPPVDGKANQALLAFLSEIARIPTSTISILSGKTSRIKLVSINGLDKIELLKRIQEQLTANNKLPRI